MIECKNIEDPEALVDYLRQSDRIDLDEKPTIANLAGGVSNRTVLVSLASGEEWVLKQALSKLRVTVDWFSEPSRIKREAAAMQYLTRWTPAGAITRLIFLDESNYILGMEAVPQPHENWKNMLLRGEVCREHIVDFAVLLASIHRNAFENRKDSFPAFEDRSFFESLRLEPYYGYTATQVSEASNFLHELIEDTLTRQDTVVHGDYSPKNVLVHDNRLVLLDHEVIHFGEPAFDIGFSLTHLLGKALHLRENRSVFAKSASLYWHTYLENLGNVPWLENFETRCIRHTLGCLLARSAGRSLLEYLDEGERGQQISATLDCIADQPHSVDDLITNFCRKLK